MVRAIISGEKTQTRRVIRPQPPFEFGVDDIRVELFHPSIERDDGELDAGPEIFGAYDIYGEWGAKCPFGKPGDRLWVREAWADLRGMGFDHKVAFSADTVPGSDGDQARKAYGVKWKPSIHMPRWASRLVLEITEISVERLQDGGDREFWGEKLWKENPWVWVIEFKKVTP